MRTISKETISFRELRFDQAVMVDTHCYQRLDFRGALRCQGAEMACFFLAQTSTFIPENSWYTTADTTGRNHTEERGLRNHA